jgi:hypothetical protein
MKGGIGSSVTVETSSSITACGYPFESGKRYLVYAYGHEQNGNGKLETGTCTGTKLMHSISGDEIEVLRSLGRGRLQPRIYGEVLELRGGIFPLPLRDSTPIQGIKVTAEGPEGISAAMTDQFGTFRFTDVPLGTYRVRPVAPENYKVGGDYWEDPTGEAKEFAEVRVTRSECSGLIRLMVRVDGRIGGQVSDGAGRPARQGIRISLISADRATSGQDQAPYIPAYTDKDGRYEFRGLPEGKYLLGINLDAEPHRENPYPKTYFSRNKESNEPAIISLGRGEILAGHDLQLPLPIERQIIDGRVLWESGGPAKDVLVFVGRRARADFEDVIRVRTDAKGRFRAECLSGLRYRVSAQRTDGKSNGYGEIEVLVEPDLPSIVLVLKSDRRHN